ncbi:actin cortical patch [Niveomyces insectorum RCEF 264]|uniref:Actin cortical patch n=1 Tax=Niveomyces insectorum RCEF 264 TaxID=1081102 RepID=A0A167LGI2_9HYPO|nr:actin cortical patch [Niveomyces insectorum RCEF 264]
MATITVDKILAASPTTIRGQPTQLSTDAKGQRITYASGKSIFVRSIDDPSISKQYTGHAAATTVARFSPSGFYIASGDVSGQVRVWDSMEAVNTKGEYYVLSGRINDIAWDGDSQRIIAVGDGRERFGHCITADSGNNVGEVSGHSKTVNSVAIRQQRPLRAATVSDDGAMCFLHGAPFRFNAKADGLHTGFVFGAAFSPDGMLLVTVGADRRIQLYDGKTGEPTATVNGSGEDGHTGSIFAVSWAPDSRRFVTASADQTVRVWDVHSGKAVQTWRLGSGSRVASVSDQQVGVAWPHGRSDDLIISLSLNGNLNYFVVGQEKPVRIIYGHNKSITALGAASNGSDQDLWTGSFDGRVCHWDVAKGEAAIVNGPAHTNLVIQFAASPRFGRTYSVGWDDMLRIVDEKTRTYAGSDDIKLTGQPKGVAATVDGYVFVALVSNKVAVYLKDKLLTQVNLDYTPVAIAAHGSLVAVGSSPEPHIVAYKLNGSNGQLTPIVTLTKSSSAISALAFSKDGRYLAAGNASGKIVVYETETWQLATDRWSAHTARVTSLAWNDTTTHAVSGGLDTNVFVWSLAKPGSRVKALNAHKDGVNGVAWIQEGQRVASVGVDAALKFWKVEGLPATVDK